MSLTCEWYGWGGGMRWREECGDGKRRRHSFRICGSDFTVAKALLAKMPNLKSPGWKQSKIASTSATRDTRVLCSTKREWTLVLKIKIRRLHVYLYNYKRSDRLETTTDQSNTSITFQSLKLQLHLSL